MEELFKEIASRIALGVEAVAALIIVYGAAEAVTGLLRPRLDDSRGRRKRVWHRFGLWLILGLEFMLAADIVRTAISPTWDQIGQLASIAVIRTFLNFFLERDVEKYDEPARVSNE
ncbi:MAG: hypothetical protein JMDDDDMK_02438 [Acidobacteria bacterium]|nr:hypothetical protein [Acidobacteriota bacterium]